MGISSVLTTVQYSTVQYSTVHSTVQDLGDGEQRKSSILTTGSGLMLPLIFSPHRTSDTTQHSAHNRSYGHLLWQSFLGLNCHLYSVYRHFVSRYYFHTMHLFNLPEMLQSIIFSFTIYIFHCEMFFNFAIFHPLCWARSGGAAICMIERYSVHQPPTYPVLMLHLIFDIFFLNDFVHFIFVLFTKCIWYNFEKVLTSNSWVQ